MMKNKKEDLKMVTKMKNSYIDLNMIAGFNGRLLHRSILIDEIREEEKIRRGDNGIYDENLEFLKETRQIE